MWIQKWQACLNSHLKKGCVSIRKNVVKEGFQCHVCKDLNKNVFFKDKAKLKFHINERHSQNALTCDECNFQSGYESVLLLHKRRRHKVMACNTCTYSGLFNAFSVHLKNIHGEPKPTRLAKNILKCLSCNEIPITKTFYQIHTYWKHSADTLDKLPKNKDKRRRDSRGCFKVEASIIPNQVCNRAAGEERNDSRKLWGVYLSN